jgi:hypothetical protein
MWFNPLRAPLNNAVNSLLVGYFAIGLWTWVVFKHNQNELAHNEVAEMLRIISQDSVIRHSIDNYTILSEANLSSVNLLKGHHNFHGHSREEAIEIVKYCILQKQEKIFDIKILLSENTDTYRSACAELLSKDLR